MRWITLCGSTRRHSFNTRLLQAAAAAAPEGVAIVHAPAASNLGQMLVKICKADGIGLVVEAFQHGSGGQKALALLMAVIAVLPDRCARRAARTRTGRGRAW